MDNNPRLENNVVGNNGAPQTLLSRRLARGYSLDNLAVATGLTIDEIGAAEGGNAPKHYVERIELALR
jgi:transcriptional regulator with XRE-family HTH domain